MNLTNYYWYFQSAIPERICDEIVKYGKSISDEMAVTGGFGGNQKLNQNQIKDLRKKKNAQRYYQKDLWLYFLVLFGIECAQLKKDQDTVLLYGI